MARIVVTRPAGREADLLDRLRALGHEPVHVPLVATESLGEQPVDVAGYDWVVLTSVVGARELRRRMRGRPRHVAAIGKATADAFGGADLIAATSTQEGLLAAIPRPAGRVLFAGAAGARSLLPKTLGGEVVALYRTMELAPETWPEGELVVLMSPSAARAYGRLAVSTPIVSLGPETTRAAIAAGATLAGEATTNDLDGIVAAVERALRS